MHLSSARVTAVRTVVGIPVVAARAIQTGVARAGSAAVVTDEAHNAPQEGGGGLLPEGWRLDVGLEVHAQISAYGLQCASIVVR